MAERAVIELHSRICRCSLCWFFITWRHSGCWRRSSLRTRDENNRAKEMCRRLAFEKSCLHGLIRNSGGETTARNHFEWPHFKCVFACLSPPSSTPKKHAYRVLWLRWILKKGLFPYRQTELLYNVSSASRNEHFEQADSNVDFKKAG